MKLNCRCMILCDIYSKTFVFVWYYVIYFRLGNNGLYLNSFWGTFRSRICLNFGISLCLNFSSKHSKFVFVNQARFFYFLIQKNFIEDQDRPKQNNKGTAYKLTDMPLSRLHLQRQKCYSLNKKKSKNRIEHRPSSFEFSKEKRFSYKMRHDAR